MSIFKKIKNSIAFFVVVRQHKKNREYLEGSIEKWQGIADGWHVFIKESDWM
jgi:hypothetical protein